VIIDLAGGVEQSKGVNADYGDEYVGTVFPGDGKGSEGRSADRNAIDKEEGSANKSSDLGDSKTKDFTMFEEDETSNFPGRGFRPGDMGMGMEDDLGGQEWAHYKMPHHGAPRPVYDHYPPPHDVWRPFYRGRGWRPRGPPEYWTGGRGYGGSAPDGRGRYWNFYPPRRPGRRLPHPKYVDDYGPVQPGWPRREDRSPGFNHGRHREDDRTGRDQASVLGHHKEGRYRSSAEREEGGRSGARSHTRETEARSIRDRDYGRSHRRDDYDDRHRDRKRSGRSSEKESRRRGYSKERRGRNREDKRGRRHVS